MKSTPPPAVLPSSPSLPAVAGPRCARAPVSPASTPSRDEDTFARVGSTRPSSPPRAAWSYYAPGITMTIMVSAKGGQRPVRGAFVGTDHHDRLFVRDASGYMHLGILVAAMGAPEPFDPLRGIDPAHIHRPDGELLQRLQLIGATKVVNDHVALRYAQQLARGGDAAYFVGGAVRDQLAGRAAAGADVDLVSNARPTALRRVARAVAPKLKGGGAVVSKPLTGFGSVPVYGATGAGIDLNTLKAARSCTLIDPDTGRRVLRSPLGSTLLADAMVRDFACNALYYDPIANVLVDPTGLGLADAQAGRLRFVRPDEADASMALRFFKFRLHGFTALEEDRAAARAVAEATFGRRDLAKAVVRTVPKDIDTVSEGLAYLDQLGAAMEEDDCGDLYRKYLAPQAYEISQYLMHR